MTVNADRATVLKWHKIQQKKAKLAMQKCTPHNINVINQIKHNDNYIGNVNSLNPINHPWYIAFGAIRMLFCKYFTHVI